MKKATIPSLPNFIVVDTEGKESLREIAVIDATGKVIYEAFAKDHHDNDNLPFNVKPLKQILEEFLQIAINSLVIFHYAKHDLQVLRQSCDKVGVKWFDLNTDCTLELSQQKFPDFPSHSLEYLSKKLGLKVNDKDFDPEQAHTARYDALFTHQLYQEIIQKGTMETEQPSSKVNPFSSNRVDNPFQDHIDFKNVYKDEFGHLKWVIEQIKQDKNHQSKGVAVIGEPGSGKTHLMMRLAKDLLKVNRLLFIRSPNNSESVLYHIYCRVLDSFIYKVSNSEYSQLEFLFAHSLVKLVNTINLMSVNQMDKDIANWVKNNPLNLYEQLKQKDFESQKNYWEKIEKNVNGWWILNDDKSFKYAPTILKGIIKFCRYGDNNDKKLIIRWLMAEELDESELNRLGLDHWKEEMNKEDFSLQAISVFSKLSLLDEPLIIIFDQLESLGLDQNKEILLSFGEVIKEIFTHVPNSLIILNLFPERWEDFKLKLDDTVIDRVSQYKLVLSHPTDENLQEILSIKAQSVGLDLSKLFTQEEIKSILAHSSIRKILNSAEEHYLRKNPRSEPIKITKDCITNIEKEFQVLKRLFQNKELQTLGTSLKKMDQDLLELQEKLKEIVNDPDPTELIRLFLAQSRSLLEQQYKELQTISCGGDRDKLNDILTALKTLKKFNFTLHFLRLGNKKIPDHLVIERNGYSSVIAFLNKDGNALAARLKNFNQLVIKHNKTNFWLWRDIRQSDISSKEEIQKLNNTGNGKFRVMEKEDRISFELIHKLINDINNRDLDVSLETAWQVINQELSDCWLLKVLNYP